AAELSRQSGGRLMLVNVFSDPAYAYGAGAFAPQEMIDRQQLAAVRALDELRSRAEALGAPAGEAIATHGVAWEEIVNLARGRESDLIVMGTHGRTGLKHVLLGSVAERVIRHAPCSVLVVRAPQGVLAAPISRSPA